MYSTSCAFFQFKPPVFRVIPRSSEDSRVALASLVRDRRMSAPGNDGNVDYDKSTDLYLTYEARDDMIYECLMRDEGYELDPMVIAKRVKPCDMGDGPMWPNYRQAHQVLRRRDDDEPGNSRVIILSDGLADPCDPELGFTPDPKLSGFGYEVVGEFRRSKGEKGDNDYSSTHDPYQGWIGWEVLVADSITQLIVNTPLNKLGSMGVYPEMLDEVFSGFINIPNDWNCPDHFVNRASRTMGFLYFWSRAPWLPTTTVVSGDGDGDDTTLAKPLRFPEGSAGLFCFRLITPSQRATLRDARTYEDIKQARLDLVKGWETDGSYHITDISPPSPTKITSTSKTDNSNSQVARMNFFDSIGKSSPFIMPPMDGIRCDQHSWPARPAWRAITVKGMEGDDTKGGCIVHASDGLTDPWDDEVWNDIEIQCRVDQVESKPNVGLGFELIMGSIDLPDSIVYSIVKEVSYCMFETPYQQLQIWERLREDELALMKEFEWLSGPEGNNDKSNIVLSTSSIEIICDAFPEEYKSDTGTVGILLDGGVSVGLPLTFPLLQATTTNNDKEGQKAVDAHVRELIVLHPEELGHIRSAGPIARTEIARRIRALQTKWCSSASRPSVVPVPPPPPGRYTTIEECVSAVEAWPPNIKLRFSVGTVVEANIGTFTRGKIIKQWEEGNGRWNAYRVEIEDGNKINVWAPEDTDEYVRLPK